MNRRGFLKAMLAAAAAPAVVRAENLMKLYVPSQEVVVPAFGGDGPYPFGPGDWTIEAWMKPTTGEWNRVVLVRNGGVMSEYLNGNEVPPGTLNKRGLEIIPSRTGAITANFGNAPVQPLMSADFRGHVGDFRVTMAAREQSQILSAPPDNNGWYHFMGRQ